MKTAALTVVALSLAGCASVPQEPYVTPQVLISGGTAEDVKIALIPRCIELGATVEVNTPDQLVCAKPMDDSFGSMMFRAMATPSNSTRPVSMGRWTFVRSGATLLVTFDETLRYQTAFGQNNVQPIRNPKTAASVQNRLNEIKRSIESRPATPPASG